MDDQLDLAAKIEKLRRDIFWTRLVGTILLLCLATIGIASRIRHPKTIEANEFLLKDRAGNVPARLGHDLGDTCLTLMAREDISNASLCVQDGEGAILDLHNLKSESRTMLTPGFASLEPAFQFQPGLVIDQAMNRNFVSIYLGAETKLVMGHDSKDSVSISSRADEPRITLFGTNEKPLWSTHH